MSQHTAHRPAFPPERGEPPAASTGQPESAPPVTRTTGTVGAPASVGAAEQPPVHVPHPGLVTFVSEVLAGRWLPPGRARAAAEALCHGDLTGFTSHGVTNLTRLYLPLLDSGRCDPEAEPKTVADRGPSVLWDARRALGLWAAGAAMDLAVRRAREYGIGMVAVRGATHFGCAGHHALRAVHHQMVGLATANCGWQRLARPVGGRAPMLGTNPLALAAPAGDLPPFVLDMSTTAAPTGKIRAAARAGRTVPAGWLEDDLGAPVTDPAAFDRGEAHLSWLGTDPTGSGAEEYTGAHKGFGLGLLVEVLSALVPGAGTGPHPGPAEPAAAHSADPARAEAPSAAPAPRRDDDVGYLMMAIAPGSLRPEGDFPAQAASVFGSLVDCPPLHADRPVRYPGWWEDVRSRDRRRHGVPLDAAVHRDLLGLAAETGIPFPDPVPPPGPPRPGDTPRQAPAGSHTAGFPSAEDHSTGGRS